MAKTIVIKRNNGTVSQEPINSPKMRYYPTVEAAKAAVANGDIAEGELVTIGESDQTVLQDASVPVGTVVDYEGDTIPEGWLPCDGNSFDTTKYPLLFALLGKDTTPLYRNLDAEENLTRTITKHFSNMEILVLRWGKIVHVHFNAAQSYTWNGGSTTVLATGLPRPLEETTQVIRGTGGTAAQILTLRVDSAGELEVDHPSPENQSIYWYGDLTYIAKEGSGSYKIIKAVQGVLNEADSAAVVALEEKIMRLNDNNFSTTATEILTSDSSYTVTADVVLAKAVFNTTDTQYSGADFKVNGITVAALGTNSAGNAMSMQQAIKCYKGDVLTKKVNDVGGGCRVYIMEHK